LYVVSIERWYFSISGKAKGYAVDRLASTRILLWMCGEVCGRVLADGGISKDAAVVKVFVGYGIEQCYCLISRKLEVVVEDQVGSSGLSQE